MSWGSSEKNCIGFNSTFLFLLSVCTSRQCDPFKGTPMCGTDGVTYPSLCYLRKTACKRRDYSLVEAYDGGCVAGKLTSKLSLSYVSFNIEGYI